MRVLSLALGLLAAHGTVAARVHRRNIQVRDSSEYSTVPMYYMDIPVDHFDTSNKDTYKNRYYVNDTWYQTGGPVILQDMGEQGFDPSAADTYLAESDSKSSCMRLAQELNGLVIGWEHRYYGKKNGLDGYKYLTVEQALEDVAYFANNFNKTDASDNTVIQSTAGLDPYNTPWIFIGASYPGARAAWLRLTHPEIIYASWASSAPVQAQWDGSLYYDPIARALPKNCTNDFEATAKYIDSTFKSGSESMIREIQYIYAQVTGPETEIESIDDVTAYDVGSAISTLIAGFGDYQNSGPGATTQLICDYMESFNVDKFKSKVSKASTLEDFIEVLATFDSDTPASDSGIAANNENGDYYAFMATVWAGYQFLYSSLSVYRPFTLPRSRRENTTAADNLSWTWQTIQETGYYQASNDSNNGESYPLLSNYFNTSSYRVEGMDTFGNDFSESDFPSTLNNSWLLSLGGWNMKASNVMFTNGEFDPWRAFSVASQESNAGAPKRKIVQDVPACNEVSDSDDVFGLVYEGAVHASDLVWFPGISGSQANLTEPMDDGVQLFLEAWDVWSSCFNKSRDDVRNNKGVDGSGNEADGESIASHNSDDNDGDDDDDKSNIGSRAGGMSGLLLVGLLVTGFFLMM